MRKTSQTDGWKRAMFHAWIGFVLLLAFYFLTFGMQGGSQSPQKEALPKAIETHAQADAP